MDGELLDAMLLYIDGMQVGRQGAAFSNIRCYFDLPFEETFCALTELSHRGFVAECRPAGWWPPWRRGSHAEPYSCEYILTRLGRRRIDETTRFQMMEAGE